MKTWLPFVASALVLILCSLVIANRRHGSAELIVDGTVAADFKEVASNV